MNESENGASVWQVVLEDEYANFVHALEALVVGDEVRCAVFDGGGELEGVGEAHSVGCAKCGCPLGNPPGDFNDLQRRITGEAFTSRSTKPNLPSSVGFTRTSLNVTTDVTA